jgi:tetratricopeptide (TPR) repeat protein
LLEARDALEEATRLDPDHAEALAQLALVYAWLGQHQYLPKDSTFPVVLPLAERALEIDSTLSKAHEAFALAKWIGTAGFDWQATYESFMRAAELDSARAHLSLIGAAQVQTDLGRRDLALNALAQVADQDDEVLKYVRLQVHLNTGDPAGALREALAWAASEPGAEIARLYAFLAYMELGRFDEAGDALQDWASLRPDRPESALLMTVVYDARRGARDEATRLLDEYRRDHPDPARETLAKVYAWLGDPDAAFALLDEVLDAKGFAWRLPSDPLYAPLRSDYRFHVLVGRMGLECKYSEDGTHLCHDT